MEQVRDALLAEGLAVKTAHLYLRVIRRADDWCRDRGSSLADASATLVSEYVGTRPGSWSNRNLMRAAFTHYWRIEGRAQPPVKAIRVPPKPDWPCQALQEDDARVLAKHARLRSDEGDRRGLAVLFGLYIALRRAEIARLRWDAILGDDRLRLVGKGRKDATLPLHSVLLAALESWPGERDGFLFGGRSGSGHVNPATVWKWTAALAAEAGVKARVKTHQLRHTALATANDNTGNLRGVQTLARHSKPETTSHYTRTKSRALRAVVEAIDY